MAMRNFSAAVFAGAALLSCILPAWADDGWHATETLMPGDLVRAESVQLGPVARPVYGALSPEKSPIGLEIKHHVMAGHVLMARDVGPVMLVRANDSVQVFYRAGSLSMELDGRALEGGGVGQEVRVLNPSTSRTLRGVVVGPDTLEIQAAQ